MKIVDGLNQGDWLNFARSSGVMARFKLVWISPKRTRFIFTNRQGENPFSFTAEELAQTLRDRRGSMVSVDSVVGRALNAALDDGEAE